YRPLLSSDVMEASARLTESDDLAGNGARAEPRATGGHILLAIPDIAKQGREETQLRLLGAALACSANGICITDPAGTIGWGNPPTPCPAGTQPGGPDGPPGFPKERVA